MKQLLFLLLMMMSSVMLNAQDLNPVRWTFSATKGNNPNEYILTAKAMIGDGWHVFAPEPGGDGLLIPTELSLSNKPLPKSVGTFTPQRRPVTKNMEGIGMVNYYEGEIEFNTTIVSDKPITLTGKVSFQCCNDNMCLPPKDVDFKVKL